MEKFSYTVFPMDTYPQDGRHLQCYTGLPFQIRKGEDGYFWKDKKGKDHKYNIYNSYDKVDDRWIVHLEKYANQSLKKIFEVKTSKNLDKIVEYCVKLYKKSLKMEIERLETEIERLDNKIS